jgi:adenylate cyclase
VNKIATFFFSVTAWLIAVGFYMLIRFFGTKDSVDWAVSTQLYINVWLTGGLFLGVAEWCITILSDRPNLRIRSYGFLIFLRVVTMVAVTLLMFFILRLIAFLAGVIDASQILPSFVEHIASKATIVGFMYLGVVSALLGYIRHTSFMIGASILKNLLLGKYHYPRVEERIFMFLDLKSSTTYAERLGHTRFCRLIQDCFHDLTDSVIKHDVEIYQYSGDEAILTWNMDKGTRDSNCINAYFDFQERLQKKGDYYKGEYAIVPQFKAGVHSGHVTVAEIGDIKRDIAYLSDVLNTAARIQAECNRYAINILISREVKTLLPEGNRVTFVPLGFASLRGKEEKVELFGVERI